MRAIIPGSERRRFDQLLASGAIPKLVFMNCFSQGAEHGSTVHRDAEVVFGAVSTLLRSGGDGRDGLFISLDPPPAQSEYVNMQASDTANAT